MNIQEIDKWLDNEYGCSYTKLEELHDFVVEQDLKHREEVEKDIERLNKRIEDLNTINEEHKILNGMIRKELQQKENIIKEVREYLKFLKEHYEELRTSSVEDSYFINDMLRQMFIQSIENYLVGIDDILDKENK